MTGARVQAFAAALAAALSFRAAPAAAAKAGEGGGFDPGRAQTQCAQGALDVDATLLLSADDKTLDRALFGAGAAASRVMDDYLLCRALAAGRDPLCVSVPARAVFCADESAFARFIWASFRTSEGPARCLQILPPEAREGSAKVCELFFKSVREGGSPAEACAAARAAGLPPQLSKSCEGDLAFIVGDPQRCGAVHRDSEPLERCRRRAALVGALRGAKSGCQALPACAALSGEAKACERLRGEAAAAACVRLDAYQKLAKQATAAKGYSEKDRKARDPEEVARSTKLKRAEDDAAHGAALKKVALDKVKAADEKRRQRDARRAVRTFKENQPMQDIPPDVKKQMDQIEEKGRRESQRSAPRPQ